MKAKQKARLALAILEKEFELLSAQNGKKPRVALFTVTKPIK